MEIEDFQDILYEKEPETGIVTITFNQPRRKNALSLVTFLELAAALDAMENDPEARVLILTGRGEAFSSGGYFNLNFMQSLPPELLSQIDVTDIAQKKICLKFWEFDKPVIAAVNGLAIGAGFTLPLAWNFSAMVLSMVYPFNSGAGKSRSAGYVTLTGPGTITSPNPISICRETRALPRTPRTRTRTPWYSASSVIFAAVTVSALKDRPSSATSISQASFMTAPITSRRLSILPRRSISMVGRDSCSLHTENIKAPLRMNLSACGLLESR